MKRFQFRLLSLMIVVATTALAAWGYALRRRDAELVTVLRRRDAELATTTKRLSAELTSKADQHKVAIGELHMSLIMAGKWWNRNRILPPRPLDQTPQDSERHLRELEQFYGYGSTTRDQARRTILLLWLRYEVKMYFKYQHAATRPLLPLNPDPPAPPFGPYGPDDEEWSRHSELQTKIAEYMRILPGLMVE